MLKVARFSLISAFILLFAVSPASAEGLAGVFQMADGTFYHPASGLKAASEAEMAQKLGIQVSIIASSNSVVVTPVEPEPGLPVLRAANRARAELSARIAQDRLADPSVKITETDDFWRDVTLAVWNQNTDQIAYVTGKKKGTELRLSGGGDISVLRSNWINSEYNPEDPAQHVVAVRYPILKAIYEGKTIKHYEIEDAVYTPYSRDLHTKEVAVEGERHVDELVKQALDAMRADGVPSRAYPGKLMADVVDPELLKSIIVIEHSDLSLLQRDPRQAVERVYVTFAFNPGIAYNYARSSAGALGVPQFMPTTYKNFVKRTQLKLIPDFEKGMRDHVNAVRAQAAYMDDALASLPVEARKLGMSHSKVREYLAASYNGGYARVRTAIQIWDEQISGELKPAEIKSRSRLRPETIQYVKKLRLALPKVSTVTLVSGEVGE